MEEKTLHLLILEDNPDDAELMIRNLKKNQLANKLVVLEDGEQILDYFFSKGVYKDRIPSGMNMLIFLDLKLPKVHGLEILKQLKLNEETRKIPVVIVTSSREDPDIEVAYDIGANSYVVKPVNYTEFVETVNHL